MVLRLIVLVIATTSFLSSAQSQQNTIDSLIAVNRRLTDQLRIQAERAELNRQLALINADSARAAAMRAEVNAQHAVAAEQLANEKYQQFANSDSRQKTMLALYIDSTAYYRYLNQHQYFFAKREMHFATLNAEELKWGAKKRLENLDENTPEPDEVTQQREMLNHCELRIKEITVQIDSIRSQIDSTRLLLGY